MKKLRPLAAAIAVAAALSLAAAHPASAQTVAAFNQATSANAFVFTNSGTSSSLDAGPTQVVFSFLVPNSYGPVSQTIDGTLTLTSTVSGLATTSGPLVSQGLDNVDVTITANTPVNGKTDLLSFSGAQGSLTGLNGGNTAAEFVFNPSSSMSDFFNFGNIGSTFALTFGKGQSLSVANNGYLHSFRSAGNGQFTAVPETAGMTTIALMLIGTGILLFARRRRLA